MTKARATELSVFDGERLIGTIHDTSPLSFTYAQEWLDLPAANGGAVALANIPLQAGRVSTPEVEAVFENLLPEGSLRDLLTIETKSSSTFSLLLAVAGDTAGNLTILPAGDRPQAPSYEPVEWEAIAKHFEGGHQAVSTAPPMGSRISLSGAQAKMLISLDGNGKPMLPLGSTPSTWIVKPNIARFEQVWNSAVNEAILMRTAAHCGLNAAEVFFEPTTRACVVRRFDRVVGPTGAITRLKQYDLCQMEGIGSGKKYEIEGGPGVARCAELIKAHSSQPAADLMRFYQWIFFNLYTGNNDSHAKNLSLYELPGQGFRLTPFYDLMDTRLYPGLSKHFAFSIGGEDEPGKMTRAHLAAMATELNLKPAFLLNVAKTVHTKLGPAMDQAISEIRPSLDPSGVTLSERLQRHVLGLASKSAARFEIIDAPDENEEADAPHDEGSFPRPKG